QQLGTFGWPESAGNAMNATGQITGYARNTAGEDRAFLWTEGSGGNPPQMQNLMTLGGVQSRGMAINDANQIAGYSDPSGLDSHAFLWTSGGTGGPAANPQMKDLGSLRAGTFGASSFAYGINDVGQVVGSTNTPSTLNQRAFIYSDGV